MKKIMPIKANTSTIRDTISEMESKLFAMHPESERIYRTLNDLRYFQKMDQLESAQEKDLKIISEIGHSNNG